MEVGAYTYGHGNIMIHKWDDQTQLHIGKFCSIADNVHVFLGGNHRLDWFTTYPFGHINQEQFPHHGHGHPTSRGDVVIGNDVWLGSGVSIVSGVHIGNGAVIAARSHVTSKVPAYAIYGGNPARLIRMRFEPEIIVLLNQLQWWDWEPERLRQHVDTLCSADIDKLRALC